MYTKGSKRNEMLEVDFESRSKYFNFVKFCTYMYV